LLLIVVRHGVVHSDLDPEPAVAHPALAFRHEDALAVAGLDARVLPVPQLRAHLLLTVCHHVHADVILDLLLDLPIADAPVHLPVVEVKPRRAVEHGQVRLAPVRAVVQRLLEQQAVVRLAGLRDGLDVPPPRLHLGAVGHVHAHAPELHVEERLGVAVAEEALDHARL
jgi:hypothetical protein